MKRANRRRFQYMLSWLMGVMVLLLAGCDQLIPTPRASVPLNQASATSTDDYSINVVQDSAIIGETVPGMCNEVLVSDVTIGQILPSHWNSSDGKRPPNVPAQALMEQGYGIYTPFAPSKLQHLVDHRQTPTSEFTINGGKVGQDQITDEDAPQLKPNSRYLLVFIPGIDPITRGYTQKWLVVYVAYRIDAQDMVVLKEQTIEQGTASQQEEKVPFSKLSSYLIGGCTQPWP